MNIKAIVVYIDNNRVIKEEVTWLLKTWLLWDLQNEFDIVAYCHPAIVDQLPSHNNFIKKPMASLSETDIFWKDYGFVNSFAMFNSEHEREWIKSKYKYILKSDADVFLTKHIKGLYPEKIMVGYGGYIPHDEVQNTEVLLNLKRIAKKVGALENGFQHIGASIFGKTDKVLNIIQDHYIITKLILETEWNESSGQWPGWFKGVSSMYAIHIAVNHHVERQELLPYSLDSLCYGNTKIDSMTYHIHAWHTTGDFSKHKWFNGGYAKLKCDRLPEYSRDYCLWVASNNLTELKLLT